MAILSIFKSFEKYIPIDGNWQLVSERTSAKDVILDDGEDVEDSIGNVKSDIENINNNLLSNLTAIEERIVAEIPTIILDEENQIAYITTNQG